MIKESKYFNYAGVDSDMFGIMNVSVSPGLYDEHFLSNRTINEYSIRGRSKPYFVELNRDPNTLNLTFLPEGELTEERLNEIARWLDVDFYEPLMFSSMPDKVFYAMCVDSSSLYHNGNQGYITLSMRLDSPNSYSHEILTPWYEIPDKPTVLQIENRGDKATTPEIYLEKIGDGDIKIEHVHEHAHPFTINNLKDGEEIYIDGESRIIETSIPNIYRYGDSNKRYISFSYGLNRLRVTGKCRIQFQYRYKFII